MEDGVIFRSIENKEERTEKIMLRSLSQTIERPLDVAAPKLDSKPAPSSVFADPPFRMLGERFPSPEIVLEILREKEKNVRMGGLSRTVTITPLTL